MTVNLLFIPPPAGRKPRPSVKRWSLALLGVLLAGSLILFRFWPGDGATSAGALLPGVLALAALLWSTLFALRWLAWLVSEWQADGWDRERENDLAAELQRARRSLLIRAASINLPQAVLTEALSEQFLLPRALELPAVVDDATGKVAYYACFNDGQQPGWQRVVGQLSALMDNVSRQITDLPSLNSASLCVVIQIDADFDLNAGELLNIERAFSAAWPRLPRPAFLPQFDLADIDRWLDDAAERQQLLLLSLRLMAQPTDGQGEVALALLLGQQQVAADDPHPRWLHRPEQSQQTEPFACALMRALQWADTAQETLAHLWVAGLGARSEAASWLAAQQVHLAGRQAELGVIDIDAKTGLTGRAAPWLAIALAANNAVADGAAQLVMSLPGQDPLPWWLVVRSTPSL